MVKTYCSWNQSEDVAKKDFIACLKSGIKKRNLQEADMYLLET
jgi:hypothetical protein